MLVLHLKNLNRFCLFVMQIFLEIYFNFTLICHIFQYIYIKKRLFLDINLTIDVSFTNYILLLQFTNRIIADIIAGTKTNF